MKRFLEKVEKTDTCWLWKAHKIGPGYGVFWLNGNTFAHRASWTLFKGNIPEGFCVCHKCDNPSCVNPEHLFVGTHKENTHDMMQKGRIVKQQKKVTDLELQVIYRLHEEGIPQREIAGLFKVSQHTIGRYIHKKYPKRAMFGEDNNKAVLTEEDIKKIRKIYKPNEMGAHRIAKMFNVWKSTIQRVVNGKTWRHV